MAIVISTVFFICSSEDESVYLDGRFSDISETDILVHALTHRNLITRQGSPYGAET